MGVSQPTWNTMWCRCAGAAGAEPNRQQPEEDDVAIGAIDAKQKADSIVLRTLRMVLLVTNLNKAWV